MSSVAFFESTNSDKPYTQARVLTLYVNVHNVWTVEKYKYMNLVCLLRCLCLVHTAAKVADYSGYISFIAVFQLWWQAGQGVAFQTWVAGKSQARLGGHINCCCFLACFLLATMMFLRYSQWLDKTPKGL